jgi:hypothetical protein
MSSAGASEVVIFSSEDVEVHGGFGAAGCRLVWGWGLMNVCNWRGASAGFRS